MTMSMGLRSSPGTRAVGSQSGAWEGTRFS